MPEPSADSPRELLGVYLRGLCMGAADSVPGVSGGTIALITGIYERLIAALTALDPRVLRQLLRLHTTDGRRVARRDLWEMDVPFLTVLGLGVVTAVVTVSRVMHAALSSYRALTFAFFFGLILASAVALYEHVAVDNARHAAAGAVGFVVAFLVTGATAGAFPNALPIVFVSGIIAISAMILPGISGAFFLLMLGQYDYLTGTLSTFVDGLIGVASGGPFPREEVAPIVAFLAGAAVGVLSIAHVIRWALARYRRATLVFLVSLMVGALRLPVAEIAEHTAAWTLPTAAATLGAALLGGVLVLGLNHYTADLDY